MRYWTIYDEIEWIFRERLWLPWYERYGPDFQTEMFLYPIDHQIPPDKPMAQDELIGTRNAST